MSLKKAELYRGFNIFTEELREGIWGTAVVEIPSDSSELVRPPSQGRLAGEFQTKKSALEAARAHIDRIQRNRKNRASQWAG